LDYIQRSFFEPRTVDQAWETPTMTGSFDPNEIAVLARVITQAVADLGSRDESDKEMIAGRVLTLVEKGERSFQKLLAAAEH
jgi:hypothetical protein